MMDIKHQTSIIKHQSSIINHQSIPSITTLYVFQEFKKLKLNTERYHSINNFMNQHDLSK